MTPEFLRLMGAAFFKDDAPRIIRALERIATALEKRREAVLPTDTPASPFVDTEAHVFRPDIRKVSELCESCLTCFVPGAIFPMASNGLVDHAYVERCDECRLFTDDVAAALAVGSRLEREVEYTEDGRPFITGFTFERATRAAKRWNRKTP